MDCDPAPALPRPLSEDRNVLLSKELSSLLVGEHGGDSALAKFWKNFKNRLDGELDRDDLSRLSPKSKT